MALFWDNVMLLECNKGLQHTLRIEDVTDQLTLISMQGSRSRRLVARQRKHSDNMSRASKSRSSKDDNFILSPLWPMSPDFFRRLSPASQNKLSGLVVVLMMTKRCKPTPCFSDQMCGWAWRTVSVKFALCVSMCYCRDCSRWNGLGFVQDLYNNSMFLHTTKQSAQRLMLIAVLSLKREEGRED